MLPRPMRAPIAILASLGLLVAMAAVPVTAQTDTPTCTAEDASTGAVADGVTVTYDSFFVCADAATSGTWSITVEIANDEGSTDSVLIEEVTLSHTTPRPEGEGPEATAEAGELPEAIAPGASDTLEVGGEFELATTGDGELANLHLRLSGTTVDGGEFFMLGVNVQVLGPGMEPELEDPGDEPNGENGENGEAEGRPEWVPGPPPWVRALLEAIFTSGFPWGTDDFPPAIGTQDGENGEGEAGAVDGQAVADEARPDWVPGPPPWAPSDDEDAEAEETDDGPPAFVPPAGPPTIPAPAPANPGGRP